MLLARVKRLQSHQTHGFYQTIRVRSTPYPSVDGMCPKALHRINPHLPVGVGWEAVMRIRSSKGLRISSFHGHFFIRSTDLLALPQVTAPRPCIRL